EIPIHVDLSDATKAIQELVAEFRMLREEAAKPISAPAPTPSAAAGGGGSSRGRRRVVAPGEMALLVPDDEARLAELSAAAQADQRASRSLTVAPLYSETGRTPEQAAEDRRRQDRARSSNS